VTWAFAVGGDPRHARQGAYRARRSLQLVVNRIAIRLEALRAIAVRVGAEVLPQRASLSHPKS
jgi:hypothetical protein